jgi:NET1-associated nuclear protein 1 (U3 small nucleolar RNA-associated protein 17)
MRGREVFLKFWRWSEKNGDWELITRVDTPHPIPGQLNPGQVLALEAAPQGDAFITVGSDGNARVWKPKTRTRAGVPVRSGEGEMLNWGCRRVISFSKGKTEGELSALTLLDDLELPSTTQDKRWWSSAALSEDGSVLAVAAPASELQSSTTNDSVIHLIDSDTGNINQTLAGLRIGPVTGIAIVERSLVILGTSKLLVWNLVDGEVDWEYELQEFGAMTSTGSTHLTVDPHSGTFAVSFTGPGSMHRIAIFKHENPEPIHIETLGMPVAALLTTGGGKGYMFLDTQARVQYLSPIQTPHFSLALASRGQVEVEVEEQSKLAEAYSSISKGDIVQANATRNEEEDDDGVVEKVIPREALENVFGDVPAYSQRPLEEAFEGVLDLFAKRPLDDSDEEEEEEEEEDDEDSDEEMDD